MRRYIVSLVATILGLSTGASSAGDLSVGQAVYKKYNCASCHGADAKTALSAQYPILAGQHEDYLVHALHAYKRGQSGAPDTANVRKNPIMGSVVMMLSDDDIAYVAAWLAHLPSDLGVRQ
jgi:cytochrome c553